MSMMQRLQAALALAVVFFLILATNRVDNQHFENVQKTLNTVFDDRVVVQDYIYQLDNLLHQKALRLAKGELTVPPDENGKISDLLDLFADTKLTTDEKKHLTRFVRDFATVREREAAPLPPEEKISGIQKSLASLEKDLDRLAAVQVQESHRLTKVAQKSLDSTNLTSKIEIGFLIVIGLIMQLLIFVKPWGSRRSGDES